MFPTGELAKNGSKDFKNLVTLLILTWVGATIIHSIAQYKLAKSNKELADLNIKKLKSEGIE